MLTLQFLRKISGTEAAIFRLMVSWLLPDKRFPVFLEEGFQRPVASRCWEMISSISFNDYSTINMITYLTASGKRTWQWITGFLLGTFSSPPTSKETAS